MIKKNPLSTFHFPLSRVSFRRGFSLIELLIFAAIFTIIIVAFITILVAVTGIQTRELAAAEVNQQSQFLLQQIQYYIERSSLVELSQDSATSTLKLRMPAPSEDPTYIYLSGNTVYLKQTDGGTAQAMNSGKVTVSGLNFFTKRSNPPGHDSVSISFTVAYNTSLPQQKFTETLETAVARVSAATFDSNVIPSSTSQYKLGASGSIWSSVNDVINFAASCTGGSNCVGVNLGIGVAPTQVFQVGGGDVYVSNSGAGVIFKAPNGTSCFKLTITNSGQFATSSVTCT